MSKLTEKTSAILLKRYSDAAADGKLKPKDLDQKFHDHLDAGHPLNSIAQRRIMLYGNHTHINRILDQPKLRHSEIDLAHTELQAYHRSDDPQRKKDVSSIVRKLHKNFPEYATTLVPNHVHTNVKYRKPK